MKNRSRHINFNRKYRHVRRCA